MKNNLFKRVKGLTALLLMMCMVLSTFVGCKKEGDATAAMVSAVEEVYAFENYTFTESGVIVVDDEEVSFEVSGKVNGANWSMSIKGAYDTYSIDLADVMIYADNTLYINVDEVLAEAGALVGTDLSSLLAMYELPTGWYALPMPEGFLDMNSESSKESNALSASIIKAALEGIKVKKDGDTYVVTIEDAEQISILMSNFAKFLEENRTEIVELMGGSDEMYDAVYELVDMYMNAFIDSVVNTVKAQGVTVTDAEIQELRNEIQPAMDEFKSEMTTIKEESVEEVEASYDDMLAEIKDAAEELKDYKLADDEKLSFVLSNSLTGNDGAKEYVADCDFVIEADGTSIEFTMDGNIKQSDEKIEAPADAVAMEEWMDAVVEIAVMSGAF